jgi:hypothetical protein
MRVALFVTCFNDLPLPRRRVPVVADPGHLDRLDLKILDD